MPQVLKERKCRLSCEYIYQYQKKKENIQLSIAFDGKSNERSWFQVKYGDTEISLFTHPCMPMYIHIAP